MTDCCDSEVQRLRNVIVGLSVDAPGSAWSGLNCSYYTELQ